MASTSWGLTALAAGLSPEAGVFSCGPGSMLSAAEHAFADHHLHVQRFRPSPRTRLVVGL